MVKTRASLNADLDSTTLGTTAPQDRKLTAKNATVPVLSATGQEIRTVLNVLQSFTLSQTTFTIWLRKDFLMMN